MKNFKNKMGKFTITLLLVLSFIGLPMIACAEEENPTPTPTPTESPTPTVSPTPSETPTPTPTESPTPTVSPTPSNDPKPTPTPTEKPTEKKSIKLDKTSGTVVVGEKVQIKATVTGVENAEIRWTSSNFTVAKVTDDGVITALKTGKAIITASLKDDSGVTAQYTITVQENNTSSTSAEEKDNNNEKESLNLKSLKVKGYTLNEPFSSSRTGYTVDIPYEAEDVTIEVEKQSNNVKTEIKGATNLKVGRNTVTVTVRDDAGNSKVYTITVIRATKEEKTTSKNPTSHVVSQASSSLKPMSTRKNHTLEYVFVTIGCLILFAIGGLGIYFYIKTSDKDKKKKAEKKQKTAKKTVKEKVVKEEVEKEEKIETPMIEVSSDDELGKTIEFIEEAKKIEDRKQTPPDLKNESAILKEVEDLFDDE